LRVGGTETDPAERARLSAQVSTLAAPYRGVPLIKGLPVWTAAHTAEGLVLEGKVRNEAQRRKPCSEPRRQMPPRMWIDRMTLAPDMPDNWVALAEASLPVFARFQTGEMGFYPAENDAGFVVQGEAPASLIQSDEDKTWLQPVPTCRSTVWADPVDVPVPEVSGIDFTKDPAAACQSGFDTVLAANPISFAKYRFGPVPRERTGARQIAGSVTPLCAVSGISRSSDTPIRQVIPTSEVPWGRPAQKRSCPIWWQRGLTQVACLRLAMAQTSLCRLMTMVTARCPAG
jgi:hypothetical protein